MMDLFPVFNEISVFLPIVGGVSYILISSVQKSPFAYILTSICYFLNDCHCDWCEMESQC